MKITNRWTFSILLMSLLWLIPVNVRAQTAAYGTISQSEETTRGKDCQLSLGGTLENNADNPITDETRIIEILTALAELERCNFPSEKGWLHRYNLYNGVREGAEFVAHIPGDSIACDLQFSFKADDLGKMIPLRMLDRQDQTAQGYFVELAEDGSLILSERVDNECSLTNGYFSLGTYIEPHFLSDAVSNYQHTYGLLRKDPSGLGTGGIKGWFAVEQDKAVFVIEKYGENIYGGFTFDAESETDVQITSQKNQIKFDLATGRVISILDEITIATGRTMRTISEVFMDYYQDLPESLTAILNTFQSFK